MTTAQFLMSFHTFVVEAGDRPLIPQFDHHRPFLTKLVAAGFPPETIDFVVCTHPHVDHVGWNTRLLDGEWIPTFPAPATCSAPATTAPDRPGELISERGRA